jgi:hypothetical protein
MDGYQDRIQEPLYPVGSYDNEDENNSGHTMVGRNMIIKSVQLLFYNFKYLLPPQ